MGGGKGCRIRVLGEKHAEVLHLLKVNFLRSNISYANPDTQGVSSLQIHAVLLNIVQTYKTLR